ncbi:MAG: DUF58 domain-containing protein [Gammaproteobacteria bacterium]|nr:DUF58 domain-containing protein [Gammaproteobacteria bacterium]
MLKRLLYHNFRIVYRLSQWTRQRFTPAGLLILGCVIASGIFGVNTRQTLAYQIFALTAAMLVLSLLCCAWFRAGFRISRRLPEYGTVGEPLHYRVRIENRSRRHQRDLCLIDELHADFPAFEEFRAARDPEDRRRNWFDRSVGYPRLMGMLRNRRGAALAPLPVPDVPALDRAELDVNMTPIRRGYLRFEQARLARPDPLGLTRAIQTHASSDQLLVLPRLYRVPRLELGGHRRYQRGGVSLASTVGDSQEFISLRDYKPGDPLRAIHWRSFAKLGRPVVREFQDEFFVRQGLVLDTFLGGRSTQSFEEAVSIAASFAASSRAQDSLLDLMFIGAQAYRFTAGRGVAYAQNMLEILACVAPCPGDDFARLDQLVMQNIAETSGLICVFLDWNEPRRNLMQRMTTLGVPACAFIVTADPAVVSAVEAADGNGQRLVAVPPAAVQQTMDRFNPSVGRA